MSSRVRKRVRAPNSKSKGNNKRIRSKGPVDPSRTKIAIKMRKKMGEECKEAQANSRKAMDQLPGFIMQLVHIIDTFPQYEAGDLPEPHTREDEGDSKRVFSEGNVARSSSSNAVSLTAAPANRESGGSEKPEKPGLVAPLDAKIPLCPTLIRLIALLQHCAARVVELSSCVKLHIQLLVPAVEDEANHVGVAIQEEAVGELSMTEVEGYTCMERVSTYYTRRAKLATKALKYPGIGDYWEALRKLDRKEFHGLRLLFRKLMMRVILVHNFLQLNWDKIIDPLNASHLQTFL